MYRMYVAGKDVPELKQNLLDLVDALGGYRQTTSPHQSQGHSTIGTFAVQPDHEDGVQESYDMMQNAPLTAPAHAEAPAATGEVDSRGLPWDERIHAETKAKNKNGTWRNRRGIEPGKIVAIENELKSKTGASLATAPSSLSQNLAPVFPISETVSPFGNNPPATVAIPNMGAQSTPAPVVPPPSAQQPVTFAHTIATFKAQLPLVVAELLKQGKITAEWLQQTCAYFGVDMIHKINDQQAQEFFDALVGAQLVTKVG